MKETNQERPQQRQNLSAPGSSANHAISLKPGSNPEPVEGKPWLKIILFSVLGLAFTGGLVFAGYQMGQRQILRLGSGQANYISQPTPTSKATSTPSQESPPTPTEKLILTSTPDPTTDWQTYTNQEYGYQFKCPRTSIHKVELSSEDGLTKPFYQEICYQDDKQVRIQVVSLDNNTPIDDQTKVLVKHDKKIRIRGFDENYFSQILFTFKFLD